VGPSSGGISQRPCVEYETENQDWEEPRGSTFPKTKEPWECGFHREKRSRGVTWVLPNSEEKEGKPNGGEEGQGNHEGERREEITNLRFPLEKVTNWRGGIGTSKKAEKKRKWTAAQK